MGFSLQRVLSPYSCKLHLKAQYFVEVVPLGQNLPPPCSPQHWGTQCKKKVGLKGASGFPPPSWNLALPEELGSKQWRCCHKIILQYPVVPRRKTDGLSQCVFKAIIPTTLQKNPSFAYIYTKQLHSSSLLLTTDSLVIKTFGSLITVCFTLHVRPFAWSWPLISFYISTSPCLSLLQIHSSTSLTLPAPWHPTAITLLPISPPLESLFSLTTLTITTLLPIF